MQNKILILTIALSITLTGCAYQTVKPANQATQTVPISVTASSSAENKASSTAGETQQYDLSGYDITVKYEGQKKIITDNRYKFSLMVSASSSLKGDIVPIKEATEAYGTGDVGIIVATGTIESLNKGFFEEEAPIAQDSLLKMEKIVVASGQTGQAFFYDYNTPDYSYSDHSYSFLIPINNGKNILILRMGYNDGGDKSAFFKKTISTIKIY
ncbi:MAG: hypothetical protein PHO56_04485 [Patescibacteria group bacterium]|nr:hypothetical protein [Patescibacteria group bacterium]